MLQPLPKAINATNQNYTSDPQHFDSSYSRLHRAKPWIHQNFQVCSDFERTQIAIRRRIREPTSSSARKIRIYLKVKLATTSTRERSIPIRISSVNWVFSQWKDKRSSALSKLQKEGKKKVFRENREVPSERKKKSISFPHFFSSSTHSRVPS